MDLGVSGLPPPGVLFLPDRTVAELDPRPAAAGRCGREYGRYLLQGAGCGLRRPAGRTDRKFTPKPRGEASARHRGRAAVRSPAGGSTVTRSVERPAERITAAAGKPGGTAIWAAGTSSRARSKKVKVFR